MRRFWSKVKRGPGCWEWQASTQWDGYGRYWNKGKTVPAHRFSWEMIHGPIPEGMIVCHSCDVKMCVRPSPLFIGTQSENIQDAARKGRTRTVKLTVEQVKKIRSDTRSHAEIARFYGVHASTVSRIRSHHRWDHIT